MRRFIAHRFRNASALTAAFCVLLVLLPGICGAATSSLTVNTSGDEDLLHGRIGAEGDHHDARMSHLHGGAGATESPSGHVPEQDAEHCDPHGCCVAAVKSSVRQQGSIEPATIDSSDLGVSSRLIATLRVRDVGRGVDPPGSSELSATSIPLRR